jgi:hypothetical protein
MAESFFDYEEMLKQALIRLVGADKAAISGVGGAIDAGVQAATSDTAPWWLNEAADAFQGGVGWLNSQVDIPKTVEATVGMVTDTSEERAARQEKAALEQGFGPPPTLYPRQTGIPPGGGSAAVSNYEAQNPIPAKDNVKDDDDYLNQLMMAALMAGGKKGKIASLGGAAGGGISFGDKWTMNAPWEKDYRYLS